MASTAPPAAVDAASEASPPLPPFEPLFTLLTDTTTQTTVHPRVQYLFADDATPLLLADPPTTDAQGRPHRVVLVDVAPTPASGDTSASWTVARAASLSPDWAVTGARFVAQPADAEMAGAGAGASSATALQVEGVSRELVETLSESLRAGSSTASGSVAGEDMDVLAVEFRRRMDVLRKVIDEGEVRKEAQQRQLQQQQQQQEREHQAETPAASTAPSGEGASTFGPAEKSS